MQKMTTFILYILLAQLIHIFTCVLFCFLCFVFLLFLKHSFSIEILHDWLKNSCQFEILWHSMNLYNIISMHAYLHIIYDNTIILFCTPLHMTFAGNNSLKGADHKTFPLS